MIKLSTVFILLSLSATSYSKPIPDYFRDVSTEVLELKLENIGLAPLEKKNVLLSHINTNFSQSLVYIELSYKLNKYSNLKVKVLEPGSEGDASYFHEKSYINKKSLDNDYLDYGNNPGDDLIDGNWFLEITNQNTYSLEINSIGLKIYSRND